MRRPIRIPAVMLAALVLAACGGGDHGGGDGASTGSPPQVVAAPASRAVAVNARVDFDVAAIGSAPLSYQWYRNGVALAGATSATYSIPAAALSDDGARFSVAVSNGAGKVASDAATLGVFSTPGPAVTCASPGDSFTAFTPGVAVPGKAAGAIVAGCSGPLADVVWTQTAGPVITLMSDHTQAIGFEPQQPGIYQFSVTFRDAQGTAHSASLSIAASGAPGSSSVVARVDQAVRQSGNVSVRAWPMLAPGDALQSIAWAQLEGPPVELDTSDPARMLFTAPEVARDTLLRFRVTMHTTRGAIDTDDALVLVESYAQAPSTDAHVWAGHHVSRVYPYRAQSPWAGVLTRCVFDAQLQASGPGKNLCPLSTLPLLDQETGGQLPTVDQVMSRVLVSHGWMGEVFQQFLLTQDPNGDFRRLLNGVTAVVIGAHVRPSMTFFATGAIYLDADYFWLQPAQRDVIDEQPDYRSAFDVGLRYSGPWRYVLNGDYAWYSYPASGRTGRPLTAIQYPVSRVLYHELAHASDALPPAVRGSLDSTVSAWDNIAPRFAANQLPSDELGLTYPLASQEMIGLAAVKFQGSPASAAQEDYTPDQVAGFFKTDRANQEYAYTNDREDLAMLFEEVMMSSRYGVRMDFAIADPIMPSTTGNTLIVRWGERGRVAEPAIQPRAKLVVQHVAPWVAASAVDALPAPVALRAGASWWSNLTLSAPPAGVGALTARALSPEEGRALLRRDTQRP